MKKFLVLYHSPTTAQEFMEQADREQMEASMKEWMDWKERHSDAVVDFGSPLKPAKKLEKGEVSESEGWTTGFSFIQAESLDAAVEIMKDHPNFRGEGAPGIEILEFLPMPGSKAN